MLESKSADSKLGTKELPANREMIMRLGRFC